MMPKGVKGYIKRMVGQSLVDSCTIQAETTTTGSYGQNVTAWSNVATVNCRLLPAGANSREMVKEFAGQEAIEDIKRLIVPFDTALDVGQRVVVSGVTYYVGSLDVQWSDEVFRAAIVVRKVGADG